MRKNIAHSIQSVLIDTDIMTNIGQILSQNMAETAISINQINTNINGVKGQVLKQSASITQTSAAIEQIIRTIHNLDAGIDTQVTSIQNLVRIIKESDKKTLETKSILADNDYLIAQLVAESSEGKAVISNFEQEVKKNFEDSGTQAKHFCKMKKRVFFVTVLIQY